MTRRDRRSEEIAFLRMLLDDAHEKSGPDRLDAIRKVFQMLWRNRNLDVTLLQTSSFRLAVERKLIEMEDDGWLGAKQFHHDLMIKYRV